MASNQILTAAQAQAVYSAMCALDNISVNFDTMWRADDGESVRITENKYGVLVHKGGEQGVSEHYADQAAFAATYGLPAAPDTPSLLEAAKDAMALIGKLDPGQPGAVAAHQRLGLAIAQARS
ncbi:hypothetical protein [Achromobacter denitrificans]|uniref:hypothetical protein n=1 Tax=Achromobacter denitrificans TaxID=32002 RepID=UPI000B493F0D|nr:hypothetical protein [Achromobacter denitrificans]